MFTRLCEEDEMLFGVVEFHPLAVDGLQFLADFLRAVFEDDDVAFFPLAVAFLMYSSIKMVIFQNPMFQHNQIAACLHKVSAHP